MKIAFKMSSTASAEALITAIIRHKEVIEDNIASARYHNREQLIPAYRQIQNDLDTAEYEISYAISEEELTQKQIAEEEEDLKQRDKEEPVLIQEYIEAHWKSFGMDLISLMIGEQIEEVRDGEWWTEREASLLPEMLAVDLDYLE